MLVTCGNLAEHWEGCHGQDRCQRERIPPAPGIVGQEEGFGKPRWTCRKKSTVELWFSELWSISLLQLDEWLTQIHSSYKATELMPVPVQIFFTLRREIFERSGLPVQELSFIWQVPMRKDRLIGVWHWDHVRSCEISRHSQLSQCYLFPHVFLDFSCDPCDSVSCDSFRIVMRMAAWPSKSLPWPWPSSPGAKIPTAGSCDLEIPQAPARLALANSIASSIGEVGLARSCLSQNSTDNITYWLLLYLNFH